MRASTRAWWVVLVLWAPAAVRAQGPGSWRIIVNAKNPATALDKSFVADALLKKATRWPDGQPIRPVDLVTGNAIREDLTQALLNRPVAAVKSYWEQVIFSGRGVPPPELDNDEAVIAYVAKHDGALGYVSGKAEVGSVKVVAVK
jgi:ABC-type phosphate transport system substrate-binding protein